MFNVIVKLLSLALVRLHLGELPDNCVQAARNNKKHAGY